MARNIVEEIHIFARIEFEHSSFEETNMEDVYDELIDAVDSHNGELLQIFKGNVAQTPCIEFYSPDMVAKSYIMQRVLAILDENYC